MRSPPPFRAAPAPFVFFLVGLVFLVYSPALLNGFVWDDPFLIAGTPAVKGDAPLWDLWTKPLMLGQEALPFWRPLPLTIHGILARVVGLDALPFHFFSIAAHAGVAALLYYWIRGEGVTELVSFVAAALYAVHPYLTSAVTYVSGVSDPLAMLFSLVALLAWRSEKNVLAAIAWAAALCFKEWTLMVPVIAAISLTMRGRKLEAKAIAGAGVVLAVFLFARWNLFHGMRTSSAMSLTPGERVLAAVMSLGFYLPGGLVPWNLRMDRYYDLSEPGFWVWLALGAAVLIAAAIGFRKFRAHPALVAAIPGVGWFALVWFVHSNLPATLNAHVAEHWMYAAYPGLAYAAAMMWTVLLPKLGPRQRSVALTVVLVIGVAWSGRSFVRQFDWSDEVTLFEANIAAGADLTRSHLCLAWAYGKKSRYADAAREFEAALRRSPFHFGALWGLARAQYQMQDYDRALVVAAMIHKLYDDHPEVDDFARVCRERRATAAKAKARSK
ncbi:MAG: tetratricopeptide repeat protein [Verrucomicrobiae bacterium]|nr:tetratricopeptide repeat protein [Verrucomicrobiae bacterium]